MKIACLFAGLAVALSAGAQEPVPAERATNALAELPDWPVGFKLPEDLTAHWRKPNKKEATKAEILVWTPPGCARVRAVLLIPNNTDSKVFAQHAPLRAVAARHELGIVYLRRFDANLIEFTDPPAGTNALFAVLDHVARETGIAEYRHAPWITFGKSSRGRFPFRLAWLYPERVIATIEYHGETPVWPVPAWARPQDQSILHVNANGEDEWDRTWYRHVRPCLLNYRARTAWLPHQLAAPGVGHGNYVDAHGGPGWNQPVPKGKVSCRDTWDYLSLFIDKALALRLPRAGYPTTAPLTLSAVNPDSGYLIHPRAVEEVMQLKWRPLRRGADGFYTIVDHIKEPGEVYDPAPGAVPRAHWIRPAAEVPPDERRDYLWVADRALADAWLAYHARP